MPSQNADAALTDEVRRGPRGRAARAVGLERCQVAPAGVRQERPNSRPNKGASILTAVPSSTPPQSENGVLSDGVSDVFHVFSRDGNRDLFDRFKSH